jgi:hypothetical protein
LMNLLKTLTMRIWPVDGALTGDRLMRCLSVITDCFCSFLPQNFGMLLTVPDHCLYLHDGKHFQGMECNEIMDHE